MDFGDGGRCKATVSGTEEAVFGGVDRQQEESAGGAHRPNQALFAVAPSSLMQPEGWGGCPRLAFL